MLVNWSIARAITALARAPRRARKQEKNWTSFSPSFTEAREIWRKTTRSTALFLTTAAQLNSEPLRSLVSLVRALRGIRNAQRCSRSAARRRAILVIDSLGSALHPLLVRFFIQIINDSEISAHCAQILLTSHNTTLMNLEILRRDEIWLVELDESYSSTLTTVLRSRPRKRELIAKGYLRGRFGAVPKIGAELLKLAVHPVEHTLHLNGNGNKPARQDGKRRAAHENSAMIRPRRVSAFRASLITWHASKGHCRAGAAAVSYAG
jgi:hypothetical protein